MRTSRTDEILEGWKMVSHGARRPAMAPAPVTSRSSLPLGLLAASALVILALAVGGRLLSSGPGPVLPGVGASPAAPTASPSATPSTPAKVASPAPSASSGSSGSVKPTGASATPIVVDAASARAEIEKYLAALKSGDTATAWGMLAPEEQAKTNDEAGYASERRAFFHGVNGYTVTPNPTDVQPIGSWLPGLNGATIDLGNAVLVEVQYDLGTPTPADWELYIVAQRAGGNGLEIFGVR
jgi:hypothetical protein